MSDPGDELFDHDDYPKDFGFGAPGYWMNETSGVLRPAVEAYLSGRQMSGEHIAAMRAYLRQWMTGNWCDGVYNLRERVDAVTDHASLSEWMHDAQLLGIDPL